MKSMCLQILSYSRDNTSISKKNFLVYFPIQVNKLLLNMYEKLADELITTEDTKTSLGIASWYVRHSCPYP